MTLLTAPALTDMPLMPSRLTGLVGVELPGGESPAGESPGGETPGEKEKCDAVESRECDGMEGTETGEEVEEARDDGGCQRDGGCPRDTGWTNKALSGG